MQQPVLLGRGIAGFFARRVDLLRGDANERADERARAAAWDAHASDRRRVVRSLSAAQMALQEERRRTQRSLLREAPVDYLVGSISAQAVLVRMVEDASDRVYRFGLIRYDLQNQHGTEVPSRWIIAAIDPAAENVSSP